MMQHELTDIADALAATSVRVANLQARVSDAIGVLREGEGVQGNGQHVGGQQVNEEGGEGSRVPNGKDPLAYLNELIQQGLIINYTPTSSQDGPPNATTHECTFTTEDGHSFTARDGKLKMAKKRCAVLMLRHYGMLE